MKATGCHDNHVKFPLEIKVLLENEAAEAHAFRSLSIIFIRRTKSTITYVFFVVHIHVK